MNYDGVSTQADDPQGASQLITDYTFRVSQDYTTYPGFDNSFWEEVCQALGVLRDSEQTKLATEDSLFPGDLTMALAKIRKTKLFKSPGPDGLTNLMLVWGG